MRKINLFVFTSLLVSSLPSVSAEYRVNINNGEFDSHTIRTDRANSLETEQIPLLRFDISFGDSSPGGNARPDDIGVCPVSVCEGREPGANGQDYREENGGFAGEGNTLLQGRHDVQRNGTRCQCIFKSGLPVGKAIITHKDEWRFIGRLNENGRAQGYGKLIYKDGGRFEGKFIDGAVQQGIYRKGDLIIMGMYETFDGALKLDKIGVQFDKNLTYAGAYKEGLPKGYGSMTIKRENGAPIIARGEWNGTIPDGAFEYINPQGVAISGHVQDGNHVGSLSWQDHDGNTYEIDVNNIENQELDRTQATLKTKGGAVATITIDDQEYGISEQGIADLNKFKESQHLATQIKAVYASKVWLNLFKLAKPQRSTIGGAAQTINNIAKFSTLDLSKPIKGLNLFVQQVLLNEIKFNRLKYATSPSERALWETLEEAIRNGRKKPPKSDNALPAISISDEMEYLDNYIIAFADSYKVKY